MKKYYLLTLKEIKQKYGKKINKLNLDRYMREDLGKIVKSSSLSTFDEYFDYISDNGTYFVPSWAVKKL